MDAASYALKLQDQVTGPATSAAHAMTAVAAAAKALEQAMQGTQEAATKANAALSAGKESESLKSSIISGELAVHVYEKIGEAALEAAAKVGQLAVEATKFAIEASEAREKMVTAITALAGSEAGGTATVKLVDDLSKRLPQSKAQIVDWTKSLQAMGVTDVGKLHEELVATASAQALMGDQGAAAYEKIQRKIVSAAESGQALKIPVKGLGSLAEAGVNVNDIAEKMGISSKKLGQELKDGSVNATKFGEALSTAMIEKGKKPLEAAGLTAGALKNKFTDNLGSLFQDIDVSPFMRGMQGLIQTFDTSTESGKAIHKIFTDAFDGIFSAASKALPYVKLGILEIVLWVQENRTTLKQVWVDAMAAAGGFFSVIKEIASEMAQLAGYVIKVGEGIGFVAQNLGLVDAAGGTALTPEQWDAKHKATATAPAHATGGTVMQPAAGEMFASVAPGELIIPADAARGSSLAEGGASAATASEYAGNNGGGGGGHQFQIDVGGIHIGGDGKSAEGITEEMVSTIFERVALTQGVGADQ